MAGQYPDQQIAATLNRLGLKTGAGNTWTESRICALRSHQKIPCNDAKACDDRILTIEQTAELLGISASSVRQLILESKVLPATQVIAYAPWQIERASLELATVKQAVARIKNKVRSPQCKDACERPLLFSIT
jgi:DNA-binding transcriptional regulator YdaS (Cro superfamily)